MEKCLYNGKVLYAYQVLQNFDFEQEIRKCQTLTCCDCGASVFFRHGKQRTECFVHRHKEECRYGDYCKKQRDIFKYAQRQLSAVMDRIAEKHKFHLEEDVTIISDHYTAFVLRGSPVSYAIDIIDHATSLRTLEKRKQLYEEQGYRYLQVTVDKGTERKPFPEREKAYFPVKFALNYSLNNTAIIIDESQRDWSIYILDKTNLSDSMYDTPAWLTNDTLAMNISLDDIDLNNNGFYTIDSNKAFLDFCTQRKNEKANWIKLEQNRIKRQIQQIEEARKYDEQKRLEWKHKAEQDKLQLRQAEEARKGAEQQKFELAYKAEQKELQQQHNEEAHKKAREDAKKFEIKQIHEASGGYVGSKVKGEYEIFTLEQITSNKPSRNWLGKYTQQDFEVAISKIKEFTQSSVSTLFAKMCFITPDETTILLKLYRDLKETDIETTNVLEYLMIKANIKF